MFSSAYKQLAGCPEKGPLRASSERCVFKGIAGAFGASEKESLLGQKPKTIPERLVTRFYTYPQLTPGRRAALAAHHQTAQRIRAYLDHAGHGDDHAGPLFRPLRGNAKAHDPAGRMDPDTIDRLVRKHAAGIGLPRGYSAHSMRATFITTALENGARLEDVQKAAGHRDPSTTKLYDRRGYDPEKAASFFATY